MGHLLADLQLLVGIGDREGLFIRIDGDELNTLGAGLHHTIYNIVAGAADADHFQGHYIFGTCFGSEIHNLCLLYIVMSVFSSFRHNSS